VNEFILEERVRRVKHIRHQQQAKIYLERQQQRHTEIGKEKKEETWSRYTGEEEKNEENDGLFEILNDGRVVVVMGGRAGDHRSCRRLSRSIRGAGQVQEG
jgi:hypothetical protein